MRMAEQAPQLTANIRKCFHGYREHLESLKDCYSLFASFAAGAVFRKVFEGASEAAAKTQERMLQLTNEFACT
jgi:hypothetical protein